MSEKLIPSDIGPNVQEHPFYSQGFHEAWAREPLFDDAHPVYERGWRAYWEVRELAERLA